MQILDIVVLVDMVNFWGAGMDFHGLTSEMASI